MLINFIFRKKIFEKQHPHFFIKLAGNTLFKSLGINVKLNYIGQKYPKEKSVVYLYTHASTLEVMTTYSQLNVFPKSIAKKEIYRIPLLRDILYFTGSIPINRNNTKEAIEVLKGLEDELREGAYISLAPEGTRRRAKSNGKGEVLLPFKKGAFRVAKNVRCSIIPLVFYGSGRILGAKSIIPTPRTTLYVDVLPEISPEEILKYDHNELREKVLEDINKNYKSYEDSKIFNGGIGVKFNLKITFSIFLIYLLLKIFKIF